MTNEQGTWIIILLSLILFLLILIIFTLHPLWFWFLVRFALIMFAVMALGVVVVLTIAYFKANSNRPHPVRYTQKTQP
jgi:hypothetical protein